MKFKQLILGGFVVFLFFNSCAPAYVPNVANTPLLEKKGDAQVNLNVGLSGFDPQIAYAVTDHFGLMLNGSFANRTSDSTNNFHSHNFIEGGAGYFGTIGNKGRYEVYGGYGFGEIQAEYDNTLWISQSDVKYNRFFIQPAIGVSSTVFDASFSPRLVHVNLYQGTNNNAAFFLEPIISAKLGYKYVKVVAQMGLSFALIDENDLVFDYQPFMFSFGIQVNIHKLFQKTTE